MGRIIKIILFLFLSTYFLIENDVRTIAALYFYFLIGLILYDLLNYKKINLLMIWNLAYLFIINSEIFSIDFKINIFSLDAVRYLVISNNLINLGYLSFTKSRKLISKTQSKTIAKDSKLVIPLLLLTLIYYCAMTFSSAIISFTSGRSAAASEDGDFVVGSIVNALGFILPAVATYYFIFIKKTSIWIPIAFSAPIFIILFLGGTRFPLLFSLLGLVIVSQSRNIANFKFKNYLQIILVLGLLLYTSDLMKSFRATGTINTSQVISKTEKSNSIAEISNSYFSPEGIVDMTSLMFRHFQTHPHLNGSSSSFIFYFWIPRALWNDKPTMLGHWFIREYRGGFSSGHSASFGFTGDLYADFGLFSLLLIFFIGRLLRVAENFKNMFLKSDGFEVVLGAMLFPYVFFFVRSPITSSMSFLGILFFYYILKKLIFKKLTL